MNLTRFDQDGLELVIDTVTGEAFATQSGYARMSGKERSTIVKRCQSCEFSVIKTAEILTTTGLKTCELIPAELIFDWLLKDNLELAREMGKCGATVYLHQLAGFKVTSEATSDPNPQPVEAPLPKLPLTYLEALEALVASEKAKLEVEEKAKLLSVQCEDLEKDVDKLSEIVDELYDYSSIIRIAKFNGVTEKMFNWRTLKSYCTVNKLEIKVAPCPRYVQKNLYPHQAWRYCYPEYKLPEVVALVIQ